MRKNESGFSIVEVLVAIVILAVGMLALATTSIFATTQVKVADLKTERSLAVQQVVERLRAMPFDSVQSLSSSTPQEVGSFDLWWTVTSEGRFLKRISVVTSGPAYVSGRGWVPTFQDTSAVALAELRN